VKRRSRRCSVRTGLVGLGAASLLAMGQHARADEVDACLSGADRGQALRRESHLIEAREQLRMCARESCPKVVRNDCRRWLGEVDAATPSLSLRVVDSSGAPVADAHATLDGKPVTLDGRSLEIDPGDHVLHAEGSGGSATDVRITVQQGERDRTVVLALRPPTPAPVPQPAPVPASPPIPSASQPESAAPSKTIPVGAWIVGGAGIAALAGAAYFWASGLGDRSSLYSGCGQTQSCAQSDVDASRTKLVIGDVGATVGVVALGAAVWITLSGWGRTPQQAATVSVVPGGAVASWSHRF
jgi:hypothetical protein